MCGRPTTSCASPPETGNVTGWLDLNGLDPDPEKLVYPYVLNGIAHNEDEGTPRASPGKNWPSLWHIKPTLAKPGS